MGTLRFGVHRPLEDEADRLIAESLKGVTKHSDKADILTPWKSDDRRKREVYASGGVPDRSVRQGMFHRAWNPKQQHLNSRDGVSRFSGQGQVDGNVDMWSGAGRKSGIGGSLAGFVESFFDNPEGSA